jgi:hypothetical protein
MSVRTIRTGLISFMLVVVLVAGLALALHPAVSSAAPVHHPLLACAYAYPACV